MCFLFCTKDSMTTRGVKRMEGACLSCYAFHWTACPFINMYSIVHCTPLLCPLLLVCNYNSKCDNLTMENANPWGQKECLILELAVVPSMCLLCHGSYTVGIMMDIHVMWKAHSFDVVLCSRNRHRYCFCSETMRVSCYLRAEE